MWQASKGPEGPGGGGDLRPIFGVPRGVVVTRLAVGIRLPGFQSSLLLTALWLGRVDGTLQRFQRHLNVGEAHRLPILCPCE